MTKIVQKLPLQKKHFRVFTQFLCAALMFSAGYATAENLPPNTHDKTFRIGVVGDTGIGERAYHPGFIAVTEELRNQHPHLLLHLGDFVYQPRFFPKTCLKRYIREIKETLVNPFQFKLFVIGDNDLTPNTENPKGSRCWNQISQLDNNFDAYPASKNEPRPYEGTVTFNNTFIALLSVYPWQNPTPWLAPRIEDAKKRGLWVIIALHEPAITTAWYIEKRDTVLKQLNSLRPDLVLSGNQHSYERFHAIGVPNQDGTIPFVSSKSGDYIKGDGTIHIVAGGGGAKLKPFADQQGVKKRIAPKPVFDTLAKRAIMNHFLTLEVDRKALKATTYRVCPKTNLKNPKNPRWKKDKEVWSVIKLECDDKESGVTVFEQFQIRSK